jgi:hypothetical protein
MTDEKKCIFCDNEFSMFERGDYVKVPYEKMVWLAHANCIIDALTTVKRFRKIQEAFRGVIG